LGNIYASTWKEQIHNVELIIQGSAIFGTLLNLKFEGSTSQGLADESAGIDNVKVSWSCDP
jgi:hypothetical protein